MVKMAMSIIPPAPESVFECALLHALKEKDGERDGFYEKVSNFITVAAPATELISTGPFRNYTLHNSGHSKKLVHLAGHLIPSETINKITALDCTLIIYSAYLHDMAMSLTSHERDRILQSDEFSDQLQASPALADALAAARRKLTLSIDEQERSLTETSIYELHEALLAEYLRPRHADPTRYEQLIERLTNASDRKDLFQHRGASFKEALIRICSSHIQDAGVLMETLGSYQDRFPRQEPYGGVYLNEQFCAAVLRISDILDFDRERTPPILFESLGIADRMIPGAEISLKEWQKHLAVHTIEVNDNEFVVSGQSRHPVIERAIREFCSYIEREIRDTLSVLRRNRPETLNQYQFEIPISVRANITSLGYVYREMALALNQTRIFSLLMGERLYSTPVVALRELLQNSIDACMLRVALQPASPPACISISDERDQYGHYWLNIKDNGSGMDEHVLSEYFLTLGNSYSRSSEFARQIKGKYFDGKRLNPISRFGIGLASVFLIADVLHVETRSTTSIRGDFQGRLLRIEGMLSLAFLTLLPGAPEGTLIKLRIKDLYAVKVDSFRKLCVGFLRTSVIRPKIPIKVSLGEELTFAGGAYMSLKSDALALLERDRLELILVDLSRWTDRLSGKLGIFLAVEEDGTLSAKKKGQRLRFGPGGIEPRDYLNDYPGNRASVNGFSMSLKGINKAFAYSNVKLPIIYNIEVEGDDDIEYDISRQRVMGRGRTSVIDELISAVRKSLLETGLWERLRSDARPAFSLKNRSETSWDGRLSQLKHVQDEQLLEAVERELKMKAEWTSGIHKELASLLGVSNALASRCISTLIAEGRLNKPESVVTAGKPQGSQNG